MEAGIVRRDRNKSRVRYGWLAGVHFISNRKKLGSILAAGTILCLNSHNQETRNLSKLSLKSWTQASLET